ncbi:hypothetical protein B0H16DRAFT_401831 [Mycena metata]|uniref:Uncharacterized protein n=1 Tax=Mycena metata TaxID=1033252 RepID=A0AAD7JJE8_9AGAR|nr:hypothetical protein B0H16DRAFT_401831 [Mycena metata]
MQDLFPSVIPRSVLPVLWSLTPLPVATREICLCPHEVTIRRKRDTWGINSDPEFTEQINLVDAWRPRIPEHLSVPLELRIGSKLELDTTGTSYTTLFPSNSPAQLAAKFSNHLSNLSEFGSHCPIRLANSHFPIFPLCAV